MYSFHVFSWNKFLAFYVIIMAYYVIIMTYFTTLIKLVYAWGREATGAIKPFAPFSPDGFWTQTAIVIEL